MPIDEQRIIQIVANRALDPAPKARDVIVAVIEGLMEPSEEALDAAYNTTLSAPNIWKAMLTAELARLREE